MSAMEPDVAACLMWIGSDMLGEDDSFTRYEYSGPRESHENRMALAGAVGSGATTMFAGLRVRYE